MIRLAIAFAVILVFSGVIPGWTGQSRTAAIAECRLRYFDRTTGDQTSLVPDCMSAKYFSFDSGCLRKEGKTDPDGDLAKALAYDAAKCYRPVTPANWIASALYN
jgi:hypothetical protein